MSVLIHGLRQVLVTTLLLAAGAVQAWGPSGHQTVGAIADQLIAGTNAAKQVRAILGSNLQTASVWADCAKGVKQAGKGAPLKYQGAGDYPECAVYENPASRAAMEAFVKRNASACYANSSDEACRHKAYHYTDVSNRRDHYEHSFFGAGEHDLVAAIDAAVVVLQGGKSPAPFDIRGKKEALRLLSHYLGDLHQPLHVVSIYLDAQGQVVDPDAAAADPKHSTHGGNSIWLGGRKLHAEWDGISGSLLNQLRSPAGAAAARQVPATAGARADLPEVWASETVRDGRAAFTGLRFGARRADGSWPATAAASYAKERAALQRQQLLRAGARLAEVLTAIWP